jgi:hypothetical protein
MIRIFALLAALLYLIAPAQAQSNGQIDVISSCGSVTLDAGKGHVMTQDTSGRHCVYVVNSSQYPSGATPITASATGSTGAITATLAGVASKTTYICGFYFTGTNATSANTATTLTITGTISGTLSFGFPTLAAAATVPNSVPLDEAFQPCIPASATNTAIVVNGPALGTGATLVTAVAWGYQL